METTSTLALLYKCSREITFIRSSSGDTPYLTSAQHDISASDVKLLFTASFRSDEKRLWTSLPFRQSHRRITYANPTGSQAHLVAKLRADFCFPLEERPIILRSLARPVEREDFDMLARDEFRMDRCALLQMCVVYISLDSLLG